MSEKILTPKFLTREVAEKAVKFVLGLIEDLACIHMLDHFRCHIVILAPSMKDDRQEDYPDYPDYTIKPHVLYEFSLGNQAEWSHKFNDIAKRKALQFWHERNDNRTDCQPHLLFPGDTPWWGGVKRDGIVVACSGFQPYFDKMFSGMIADMCIALAYHNWSAMKDNFEGDFLP